MYDVGGEAASATPALSDRVAALRAWEDSWNALAGGHDGDVGSFWQDRPPDLRIALPPSVFSSSAAARVRYIVATIVDPDPSEDPEQGEEEEDGQFGSLEAGNRFSFGPWFITATRCGFNVRASYSYLDLHGCLGGVGGGGGGGGEGEGAPGEVESGDSEENGDRGADYYDRVDWTVIKIPVKNVVEFALSAELDLAAVVSFRFGERSRLTVRPLRFRDGTPHPCAKVPTMRLSVPVTDGSMFFT
jgi:hypothetical protein